MALHQVFFFLTLFLLPTQLGKHFFPDWALVLGRRLDYLSPTIYLTDITILLTLVSFLLSINKRKLFRFIQNFISTKFVGFPAHRRFIVGGIGFVVFIGLNISFSISPLVALTKWIKVLEFFLFGWYIVKTKPNLFSCLTVLSLSVFYSSLIAIIQFILQHSIGGPLWFLGERMFDISTPGVARIQPLSVSLAPHLPILQSQSELLRPYATFPHPNVLGGFLAITLPLLIYKSINKKVASQHEVNRNCHSCKSRNLSLLGWMPDQVVSIILGITALILTFSRSAWLAGIIGMTLIVFLEKKFVKIGKFTSVSAVAFAAAGFVALFLMFPYFQSLSPESESVFVRNELNSAAISMILPSSSKLLATSYNLLFGVGLGNFLVELPKYYPHRDIFFLQPVHNIYLLLLSETGIIGLLFCIWWLWKIIQYAIHNIKKYVTQKSNFFRVACFVSLVTYLLLGFVDHYPLTLQQGQILLTILISFSLIK